VRGSSRDFVADVLGDLRAGLDATQIDVCEPSSEAKVPPLASVAVVAGETAPLAFVIEVVDSVTKKRVARSVDLGDLPADGRALALAVATEELLRATWAELALRGVRKPETAAPPEVRAAVETSGSGSAFEALGARVSFEYYGGGQTHYGGDAFWIHPLGGWFGLELAIGARNALTVSAPHGTISAGALAAQLALKPTLIRLTDFEVAALVGVQAARVTFTAEPEGQTTKRDASGFTLYGRGGFAFALGDARSLRSHTHFGAGVPLSAFSAADGGHVATGVSEFEIFATTGISLGF